MTQQQSLTLSNPIISQKEIQQTIESLADKINQAYAGLTEPLIGLIILEGANRFASDLLKSLNINIDCSSIQVKSYQGTESTGQVELCQSMNLDIAEKCILIIDDIYDTGRTLRYLIDYFKRSGASEIKTCVLWEKNIPHEVPVHIDFCGRKVPNQFLVGYGLDYNGQYRDLDYIAVLE